MSASLIRPGGYGRARVLDDVGHLALHRAPGLRCLTWSRPSGLAGDGSRPRRTHSRLGGAAVVTGSREVARKLHGLSGRRRITPLSTDLLLALGLALLWP